MCLSLPGSAPLRRPGGFSLAETVLTMGLVAGVLLPLIALMGSTRLKQRAMADRMASSYLAAGVFDALASGGTGAALALPGREGEDLILGPAAPGAVLLAAFDREGRAIRALSAREFASGIPDPAMGEEFLVEIRFSDLLPPTPGSANSFEDRAFLVHAAVSVERPVQAAQAKRRREIMRSSIRLEASRP